MSTDEEKKNSDWDLQRQHQQKQKSLQTPSRTQSETESEPTNQSYMRLPRRSRNSWCEDPNSTDTKSEESDCPENNLSKQ